MLIQHGQSLLMSFILTYFILLVKCATDFSKQSFLQWVKGAVFTPMMGVCAEVWELQHSPFQSTATCPECRTTWEESGLGTAIQTVKWDMIRCRKDVEALVCFFVHLCVLVYIYIYTRG